MRKPELLAPAGSLEALVAALRCGADAVYIGVRNFSARRNAANFNFDELKTGAELCHLYGAKLYVALNTVIFDREYPALAETIKRCAAAGADAFIVQDIGVASLIKQIVPEILLHASTQTSIHSPDGLKFAQSLGFTRVVAARELDANAIAKLCKINMQIEVFIHGALCMSVSGQCYMSSMIGGRSANRGLCAQSCRLPAKVYDMDYALSLKDLSLIEHIPLLIKLGVSSFKIEGRMKRPEYVAAAVTAVRNAINGEEADISSLRDIFSRSGFTDGYFTGKRNSKMFGIRTRDDVVSARTAILEQKKLYDKTKAFVPIDIHCSDEKLVLSDGISKSCAFIDKKDMPPMGKDLAVKCLSKLGGSIYYIKNIETSGDIRLPISMLNAARRSAVAKLNELRIARNTPRYNISPFCGEKISPHTKSEIKLRIQLPEGKVIKKDSDIVDKWIVPLSDASNFPYPHKMIIAPPRFIVDEDSVKEQLSRFKSGNLLCTNPAYITMGKELNFTLHGGFGLNLLSTKSLNTAKELGLEDIVLSPEITLKQISLLGGDIPRGIIAYGRVPFMLLRCCPIKSSASCRKCQGYVTDRTGRKLPLTCGSGYSEVLNSEKIWLADKLDKIHGVDFLLLLADKNDDVLSLAKDYSKNTRMPAQCTRGLYFRGLEE